jgi:hypothetical protein
MAAVGDRIQVPSKRVGQLPREGVVIGVTGAMLRVQWSGGEESAITPSMGSLIVVGKVKVGVKKGAPATRAPAKKAGKALPGKLAKPSRKAGSAKASSKRSGAQKRGR